MRLPRLLIAILLLVLISVSQAAVLNVPDEYPDLTTAMLAAAECDTIQLDSGNYSGEGFRNLPVSPYTCITLCSKYGAELTTIDLQNGTLLGYVPF